jgi:hypothetical protein
MKFILYFCMAAVCWLLITVADWLLDMSDYPQG